MQKQKKILWPSIKSLPPHFSSVLGSLHSKLHNSTKLQNSTTPLLKCWLTLRRRRPVATTDSDGLLPLAGTFHTAPWLPAPPGSDAQKIFSPGKYSPLKNIHPWKIFTPRRYNPLWLPALPGSDAQNFFTCSAKFSGVHCTNHAPTAPECCTLHLYQCKLLLLLIVPVYHQWYTQYTVCICSDSLILQNMSPPGSFIHS